MRFGIAILRAVIGGLFIGHGLQKLKAWFGGFGLEGTGGWMESVGLYPGKHHATAAGAGRDGGRRAAGRRRAARPSRTAALTGSMTVAILKVHGPNGIWGQNNGYELPLVMTAALFAITASGPGHARRSTTVSGARAGQSLALAAGAARWLRRRSSTAR